MRVELDARGRSVVRELRCAAPLTLVHRRAAVAGADGAIVHLVSSAAAPLGGDELRLRVHIGPGARLQLRGTAATVALPGRCGGASSADVRMEIGAGGSVDYRPGTTVVTARAEHRAAFRADLAADARLRCREVLVLGRHGEPSGELRTTTDLVRDGVPLLRQHLDLGPGPLADSAGHLAGARVLGTETLLGGTDPATPSSGPWWSLVPLPAGGALATALAADVVTARRRLTRALQHHPEAAVQPPEASDDNPDGDIAVSAPARNRTNRP
nr:urease accessory protein UreD [Saccharopolyspora gloriosae]